MTFNEAFMFNTMSRTFSEHDIEEVHAYHPSSLNKPGMFFVIIFFVSVFCLDYNYLSELLNPSLNFFLFVILIFDYCECDIICIHIPNLNTNYF
ncbi:hypothetical protein Hanom_Chr07g00672571 [Helianthus anomalus]